MQIETVAVIGAGTMGASIAVALITKGYRVLLKDVNETALLAGQERINKMLASLVKKGMSPEEAEKCKELLTTAETYQQLANADLIIEAVLEKLEIKAELFQELEKHCRKDCILASNTSSLSITEIASFTRHPERVVGLHFFNPAHLMKLVEVIAGLQTSESTVEHALAFGKSLGKLSIRVEECASFLVNRLLGRYMTEALWCLQEGIASVSEIDKAATDYLMPIGPLALRDMNGADIGLSVAEFNYKEYGERFRPAPLLEKMVRANCLGQKTGKGFYLYDPETKKRTEPNPELNKLIDECRESSPAASLAESFAVERLFLPMINEAFLALQENICAAADLDPALMAGLGMRKGPLAVAEEIGLARCVDKLEALHESHGERFRPAPLLKRYVRAKRNSVLEAEKTAVS